jgi:hypothetical protein
MNNEPEDLQDYGSAPEPAFRGSVHLPPRLRHFRRIVTPVLERRERFSNSDGTSIRYDGNFLHYELGASASECRIITLINSLTTNGKVMVGAYESFTGEDFDIYQDIGDRLAIGAGVAEDCAANTAIDSGREFHPS